MGSCSVCYRDHAKTGPCQVGVLREAIKTLRECLLTNVEGQECYCGEAGMTASGVGVCMAGDECRLSWADRLLVNDFGTAVGIEEKT